MVTLCVSFLPVYYRSSIHIEVVGNFGGSDFCTNFWVQEGGSGPGPLGSGDGGGGGGNAPPSGVPWWELPPCPALPRGIKTDIVTPCMLGWVLVNNPIPPIPEPIDSMLARYSRTIKDTAIYIYDNLSQPNNVEYAFTGILYNGQVTVIERTTNNDSLQVFPKVMIGNLTLLFTWHSHVSRSVDLSERGSFSPDDIDMLRNVRCLKQKFTSFADCRNKRYSLVITDVAKATAFFNTNTTDDIWDNHTTAISGTQQAKDEARIINVIGSSSVNGISFYVSNDSPNFQTWTLLNQ
jgi:hypothetical protein